MFFIISNILSLLSSGAVRLWEALSHLAHCCTRVSLSGFEPSQVIVGIRPRQSDLRSPGVLSSTCLEVRQRGQWLRKVPLAGSTFLSQASQVKLLFAAIKFLRIISNLQKEKVFIVLYTPVSPFLWRVWFHERAYVGALSSCRFFSVAEFCFVRW